MSRFLAPSLIAAAIASSTARADLVVPEVAGCRGKKAGDACDGGTCKSSGSECQAGACRRHADEASCTADPGCRWSEVLVCEKPSAAAPPTTAASAAAEKPSSCACAPQTLRGAIIAVLLWAIPFRRGARRRTATPRSGRSLPVLTE